MTYVSKTCSPNFFEKKNIYMLVCVCVCLFFQNQHRNTTKEDVRYAKEKLFYGIEFWNEHKGDCPFLTFHLGQ